MGRTKKEASFEKDLEQLEAIVAALEAGGLSLDESLKKFEEGIRLARACEKALSEAEKRIEILTRNTAGELEAKPFDEEEAFETEATEAERGAVNGDTSEPEPPEPPEPEAEEEGELLF